MRRIVSASSLRYERVLLGTSIHGVSAWQHDWGVCLEKKERVQAAPKTRSCCIRHRRCIHGPALWTESPVYTSSAVSHAIRTFSYRDQSRGVRLPVDMTTRTCVSKNRRRNFMCCRARACGLNGTAISQFPCKSLRYSPAGTPPWCAGGGLPMYVIGISGGKIDSSHSMSTSYDAIMTRCSPHASVEVAGRRTCSSRVPARAAREYRLWVAWVLHMQTGVP